jgi:hypothetical protein
VSSRSYTATRESVESWHPVRLCRLDVRLAVGVVVFEYCRGMLVVLIWVLVGAGVADG